MENKKSPSTVFLSRTNKKLIRGATLIRSGCCALCGIQTYPRQLTYANTLQNTLHNAFHCTLSGPFDELFFARFSAARTLCGSMFHLYSRLNGLANFITVFFSCQQLYSKFRLRNSACRSKNTNQFREYNDSKRTGDYEFFAPRIHFCDYLTENLFKIEL